MKTKLFLSLFFLLGIINTSGFAQECGGIFTDPAGANANYNNNSDYTVTICPSGPGEVVTVTFTSFSTEATWDGIYVYDGNSTSSPQISSNNPQGNGALTVPGAYWGNTNPGPFTSTSPDGCLTFRFLSDSSVNYVGWIANVTCAPGPSCSRPTLLTSNSVTQTSVTLGWTDTSGATSWEILTLPMGSPTPLPTDAGQTVTTNPTVISGLTPGTAYNFYVRTNCPLGDQSGWSLKLDAFTSLPNDECADAIVVPITGHNCSQPTTGSLTGATASADPLDSGCIGVADDDVWFQFTAIDSNAIISLLNSTGGTANGLNFAVYSGACGSLTPFYCSSANTLYGQLNNLSVGTTYYLRVYSNTNVPQVVNFGVCITIPSTCSNSESICGVNNYANTTGSPSLGTIGCLFTTPNPTFFTLKIGATGPVNLLMTQSAIGSTLANLDVDYAAWGPFASQSDGCAAVSSGQAPGIGVPGSLTTGCSYSASPTESLNIANAQAGEYYIILITNFSNQAGYITVMQSNVNDLGAGTIDCSGVRLNAFVDTNANGSQDSGEVNFPLGQFHYEINNNGNPHSIISPTGSYIIFDQIPGNTYNLSYTINADYSTLYTTPNGFTNVSVTTGNMTTYNFPVTSLQNYSDLGVTLVPLSSPRAGTSYKVKMIYTNNGTQTLTTGSLTFNHNAATSISTISEPGTTSITNGFTYGFTNLLPYESRSIIVTLDVPSIPTVYLGQLLTDSASVNPPSGDLVTNNNTSSSSQAVIGSYDPNDKIESHGAEILYSSFSSNDYLEYTIRFENNGTAGALDISVNDVLDAKLDENSLVMLAASHSYSLDRAGNNLIWNFNNIQLPVSIPDTTTGKGFVKFKIKPKPGYAVGDIIPNTAQIFFDSNPAIVTNTFNTKFVAALGNELFTEESIILYPNPAHNVVQIAIQNSPEIIESIHFHDILGKEVSLISNVASNQSTVDISQLAKGIYLVEITTNNHFKQIKKLVIH